MLQTDFLPFGRLEARKEDCAMTFGEKLYRLRKERKLSQEALALKLDVSRQAVSRWELGVSHS